MIDVALSRVAPGTGADLMVERGPARHRRRNDPGAGLLMGAHNDALFAEFDLGAGARLD